MNKLLCTLVLLTGIVFFTNAQTLHIYGGQDHDVSEWYDKIFN